MKKYTALLYTLLLLMGSPAHSALPGPATLDSLLTLPRHERYGLLRKILSASNREKKADIHAKLEFVKELTQFFIARGTPNDVLLLQIAAFVHGTCYPLDQQQTLHWGHAILKEAEAQKDTFSMANILGAIGTYHYKYRHDHIKSFECLWTVNRLILTLGPERFPGYEYSIYYLARSYFDFFDYENALRFGRPLMRVAPDKVTETHIFNTCLLGMSYYYLHKPAEARRHFRWGLRFVPTVFKNSPAQKDIGWAGIFYGDIGLTYFDEGRYDQAVPYLKKGFALTTQTRYWNNVPVFGAKLARIYLAENQPLEAKKYASLSIEAAHRVDTALYPRCRFIAEPYRVMSDYYRQAGYPALALAYADSARQADAAWKRIFDSSQKHQSEIALAREEFLMREQKAKAEQEEMISLRNRLLLATLLGGLVAVLFYVRHRQRFYRRRRQLETEKQWADAELEKARRQLSRAFQRAYTKEGLTEHAPESPSGAILHALHEAVILTEGDWEHFVQLFEKAHPGFFVRLRFKIPDLTPAETRFMALARLGYTNREMAAMLGISLGAIRQYRLRIRRKLSLGNDLDLDRLVQAI